MNFYIAVTIKENEKYYSYVVMVNSYQNLLSALNIKGIENATLCESKKRASEIVNHWNSVYKANNNFLFDTPKF